MATLNTSEGFDFGYGSPLGPFKRVANDGGAPNTGPALVKLTNPAIVYRLPSHAPFVFDVA
jgi:hypothetical protein